MAEPSPAGVLDGLLQERGATAIRADFRKNGLSRSCVRGAKCALTWVGVAGFEPAASSSRTKRAAKLRYTPPPAHLVTRT
jgi:hypothetical protein